jgi:hypothetical protein
MSSYGWTLQTTLDCTLYQLEQFSLSINRRKRDDYKMLANVSRVAQAEAKDFQSFMDSLDGVDISAEPI